MHRDDLKLAEMMLGAGNIPGKLEHAYDTFRRFRDCIVTGPVGPQMMALLVYLSDCEPPKAKENPSGGSLEWNGVAVGDRIIVKHPKGSDKPDQRAEYLGMAMIGQANVRLEGETVPAAFPLSMLTLDPQNVNWRRINRNAEVVVKGPVSNLKGEEHTGKFDGRRTNGDLDVLIGRERSPRVFSPWQVSVVESPELVAMS